MNHARALAAAALVVLLAGAAHGQSGGAAGGSGQSELAPDQAATPVERPEASRAPAEGTPEPAPRPEAEPPAEPPGEPAEEPAPETAPVPPAGPAGAPAQAPTPEEAPEAPAQAPAPEQAPEAPATAPAPAVPAEDPDPGAEAPAEAPEPAEPPVPEQLAEDDAGLAACLGRLGALGTVFERVDPVSDTAGGGDGNGGDACGIVNPISVAEIVPGVALAPAGIMRCATALALAEWVQTFVLPASAMLTERGTLAAIEHGSTYLCRRIGGGGGLSQHAFGNAVDIMAFRFTDGPAIPVEPRERDGTAAEAFQRTARASACLLFTTVLGPGQEDHDDHLHLDIEARGSDYRLCQ